MADITTSYTYTDGLTLDPDGHNQNIYDASQPAPNGIMSTANGGLSSDNLGTNFKAQPEHIQTEQVSIARAESARERIDCFIDGFGKGGASQTYNVANAPQEQWTAVPGCALRFYQPYDARVALWQWSMFFHAARVSIMAVAGDDTINGIKETPEMGLAMMLDGVLLDHTRRTTKNPLLGIENTASAPDPQFPVGYNNGGGRTADYWDMCHMSEGLTRGWHDLQLVVFMERLNLENVYIKHKPIRCGIAVTTGGPTDAAFCVIKLGMRVTFGFRNARVLTLL